MQNRAELIAHLLRPEAEVPNIQKMVDLLSFGHVLDSQQFIDFAASVIKVAEERKENSGDLLGKLSKRLEARRTQLSRSGN